MLRRFVIAALLVAPLTPLVAAPVQSIVGGQNPPLRVTYFRLDHGCATLMAVPGGTMLLDGAGGPGDGPQLVRLLRARGVKELAMLLIGTWSERYVGGALEIVKSFRVREVLHDPIYVHTPIGDKFYAEMSKRQDAMHRRMRPMNTGAPSVFFYTPVCQLRTVGPTLPMMRKFEGDPNCSAVDELNYERVSFLDLGESTAKHQKVLWDQIDQKPWGQVLQIGRDGAEDALLPSLLRPLRTKIAILPIPRLSHKSPSPKLLQTLRAAHVAVYRTDQQGSITVSTDSNHLNVKTGG